MWRKSDPRGERHYIYGYEGSHAVLARPSGKRLIEEEIRHPEVEKIDERCN